MGESAVGGLGRDREEMSSPYAELDQITRILVLFVGFILNLSPGPTLLLGSHAILNASSLQCSPELFITTRHLNFEQSRSEPLL